MTDITPQIAADRKIIKSYGDGRFNISGEYVSGGQIVLPGSVHAWSAKDVKDITQKSLALIESNSADIEVLIIGTGERQVFLDKELLNAFRAQGVVIEMMDTGAACRTYNVLLTEGRSVAAALLPIA